MQAHVRYLGVDVWVALSFGYIPPKIVLEDLDERRAYNNNVKDKNTIVVGHNQSKLVKDMHYK